MMHPKPRHGFSYDKKGMIRYRHNLRQSVARLNMQEARFYGNSTQEKLIAQQQWKETFKQSRIIFVQEQLEPLPSRYFAL